MVVTSYFQSCCVTQHPSPPQTEWDIYGISPREKINLTLDMPSRLEHLETVALCLYKEKDI